MASPDDDPLPQAPARPRPTLTKSDLGWETGFVLFAVVGPWIATAVLELYRAYEGKSRSGLPISDATHSVEIALQLLHYAMGAAAVPLVLLLVKRSGITMREFGLVWPRWGDDVGVLGLVLAGWVGSFAISLVLGALNLHDWLLGNKVNDLEGTPLLYVGAIVVAATAAIAEEVVVNGYLWTRLRQLGMDPRVGLAICLAVRVSYHSYNGLGMLAALPFGYLLTRSYAKHGRLTRPILAHFAYDAVLITLILATN